MFWEKRSVIFLCVISSVIISIWGNDDYNLLTVSDEAAIDLRRDSCRTVERRSSIEDESGGRGATIELTPSGHGVWTSYDPSLHHNRRNCKLDVDSETLGLIGEFILL